MANIRTLKKLTAAHSLNLIETSYIIQFLNDDKASQSDEIIKEAITNYSSFVSKINKIKRNKNTKKEVEALKKVYSDTNKQISQKLDSLIESI